MEEIVIRKMVEDDLEPVTAILRSWNMAPRAPTDETPDPERSGIDVGNGFVALAGDRVIGACTYIVHSPALVETASLAVHPAYKGKGVGYRLQAARLEEIRRRGFSTVRTETDRPETVAWYKRNFGYREVGANPKKHPFSLPDVDRWTVWNWTCGNPDERASPQRGGGSHARRGAARRLPMGSNRYRRPLRQESRSRVEGYRRPRVMGGVVYVDLCECRGAGLEELAQHGLAFDIVWVRGQHDFALLGR